MSISGSPAATSSPSNTLANDGDHAAWEAGASESSSLIVAPTAPPGGGAGVNGVSAGAVMAAVAAALL